MLEAREFSMSVSLFIPDRPAPNLSIFDMIKYRLAREFDRCNEVEGDKTAREIQPAAARIVDEVRSETTITITDIRTETTYDLDFDRGIDPMKKLVFAIGGNPFGSFFDRIRHTLFRSKPKQFLGHSISVNASGYGITVDVESFHKSLRNHLCDVFGHHHLRADHLSFEPTREEYQEERRQRFVKENRWGPHPRTWHRHAWGLKRNHINLAALNAQNALLDMAAARSPFPTLRNNENDGDHGYRIMVLISADDPTSSLYTPGLTTRLFRLNPDWPAQIEADKKKVR